MTVREISQLTWHSQSLVKTNVTIVYSNDTSNDSDRNLSADLTLTVLSEGKRNNSLQ